jgi:Pectate lyase superfamily protein
VRTVPRNLGLIVLGVSVAAPSGVIYPDFSDFNTTLAVTRLDAEEHTEAGTAWVNVRTFGAQGDGLSDDTVAIQKAVDGAYARKGNVVFFPSGIYVVSQIILRLGISLIGSGINPPPHGLGTILQQKPGTDFDLIVSDQPPSGYHHWSVISNMRLTGANSTKLSSGIRFAAATGEGMKFEHLLIMGFARDGIQVIGGVPFYAEDIHLFHNGVGSGLGYGLDIASKGSDPSQTYELSMISGDDNMTALIHIGVGSGIGNHQAFLIQGVKAEKHTKGRQNDVIVVDDMNGTPVVIMGVAAVNNSGELANSVVKVIRSNARLFWFGLNRDNDLPNGYTYTVHDEFNRRTFKDSAGSAGTYGGSYYFDALSTAAPDSHFGQAEANGDLAGKISIAGATSGSHAFSKPFSSIPVCTAAPTSDPGKTTWWVTTTARVVTINLSTPARIVFAYQCFGNPD